jgi:hypothetical protein
MPGNNLAKFRFRRPSRNTHAGFACKQADIFSRYPKARNSAGFGPPADPFDAKRQHHETFFEPTAASRAVFATNRNIF